MSHEEEYDDHLDEDYQALLEAGSKAAEERESRISERVGSLLASIVPLTHFDAASYWVEIVDEETAWLAAQLTRTAIAQYYASELHQEEGDHVRRWFFLIAEKEGRPFSPACLCVVPEGKVARSRMTAACHTVGFANAPAYPDYAGQIEHLATVTGLPIIPNYAGMQLPA